MKAYFEPKMNITSFDRADVITTSGGISDKFTQGGTNHAFATMDYKDLATKSVSADTQMGN